MNTKSIMTGAFAFAVIGSMTAQAAPVSYSNMMTNYNGQSQESYAAQPVSLDGSGLEVSFVWAGGDGAWEKIYFDANGMTFGANRGGSDGRNYLRTTEQAYNTVDFTAYVTVQRDSASPHPSVFFGLGTGELGLDKAPDFNVLDNPSAFMELQSGYDNVSRRSNYGDGLTGTEEVGYDAMTTVSGTMRLMMDYDSDAETMSYAIDYDYIQGAAFSADQTFATYSVSEQVAQWDTGKQASVFFGGDESTVFTDLDIVVIPEPATLGLVAAFGGAILFIRRRFMM